MSLRLFEVTIDRWSTYIVAAQGEEMAPAIAVKEHHTRGYIAGDVASMEITPTEAGVVHRSTR